MFIIYTTEGMESSGEGGPSTNQSVTSSGTIATDSVSSLVDVDLLPSTEDVAKALIDFLVTRYTTLFSRYLELFVLHHKYS